MAAPASLPLEGIRIVSFAQVGQGPAAVQMLADFGADVVKIEKPGSGAWERNWAGADAFRNGESFFFLAVNRNQRSVTIDLKDERGKEIVRRLIAKADAVVENFRPGVMDKLGLGYEALREINPRLIYCSTNGFGSHGPYRDWPGQDLVVQALSGLAAMTGRADDPPTPAGSPIVDLHAAALLAFGLCLALLHRHRTGQDQNVETSLLESAVSLQLEPLFYFINGWNVTQRSPSGLASTYHPAPYGVYPTSDGYLCLSLSPISKLGKTLNSSELMDIKDSEALERRDEVRRLIERITPSKSTEEWLALLRAADIWCGPVQDYAALLKDPQFQASEFTFPMQHPAVGDFKHLRPPVRLGAVPNESMPRKRPPLLGEHTEEILQDLGFTPDEVKRLREDGTV